MRQRDEFIVPDALDAQLRPGDGLRRGERGDRETHASRLLDGAESQIGDDDAQPVARALARRAQPDEIGAGLFPPLDAGEVFGKIDPKSGVGAVAPQRQDGESRDGGRSQRLDALLDRVRLDVGALAPGLGLIARQRRRVGVRGVDATIGEGPEVARQGVDRVDANVGALDAAPAQRQHLRAEPFDDAKTRVPLQRGRVAREGETLREGAGQGPPARVMQRARRDVQLVNAIRQKLRRDLQALAVDLDAEIVDGRRDAQRFSRA